MIKIICACGLNSEIGVGNKLVAENQKADLAHFKKLTSNNIIVLGRTTFNSILEYNKGKPLPNRIHLVLSRDPNYNPQLDDVYVYHSVGDVIHDYKENGDGQPIYICGGQQVYEQFLPYADEIHLTIFHKTFDEADSFFPSFDIDEWSIVSNEGYSKDENNEFDYNFVTYRRKIK